MKKLFRYFLSLLCCIQFFAVKAQVAEHLPPEINSEYEEREPTFSPDGNTLYFWRRNTPANVGGISDNGDIWISKYISGRWTKAIHPTDPLNTPQQNFVWQVSKKNDTLWTNRILLQEGIKDAGIGFHVKDNYNTWGIQRTMEIKDYVFQGNYKDYFIAPNRYLFVTNVGEITEGGTDIYICFPLNDTTWSKPVNLGTVVNTPGDEDAPFLSADGKTLYFDSNGYGNGGDHDIFYTERLDNTWLKWSKPKPVGRPINTAGYDFDFQISPDGKYAYWGSDTDTYGGNDIFRLNLMECELTLYPETDAVMCKGDSVILEAGYTLGNPTFIWLKDGKIIPNARERVFVAKETGQYQVIRQKKNCADTSDVRGVFFREIPNVMISGQSHYLCENDSILLLGIAQEGLTYQWKRNGVAIPGATQYKLFTRQPGEYIVKVSNGSCTRHSESFIVRESATPLIYSSEKPLVQDSIRKWNALAYPDYYMEDFSFRCMKQDAQGNIYTSGILTEKNQKSLVVDAYKKDGTLKWSKRQLINRFVTNVFMDVDAAGNVYVTSNDYYLIKFSANGSIIFQTENRMEMVTGITVDPAGNIITCGRFTDTLKIDKQEIIPGVRGNMYIAKHNAMGKMLWLRIISTEKVKDDFGNALDTDCAGNIYLVGEFERIANFANPILRAAANQNEDNFFLAKYTPEGRLDWARKLTSPSGTSNTGDMFTDCMGNTTMMLNNKIVRYNHFGGPIWQSNWQADAQIRKIRLTPAADGRLYLCGITTDETYFLRTIDPKTNQLTTIYEGLHATDDAKEVPLILVDANEDLFFAGTIKKKALKGDTPSEKTAASYTISRFGYSKDVPDNRPLKMCEGDSIMLYTQIQPEVIYQWFKNGALIANANQAQMYAKEEGNYTVKVINTSCTQLSANQTVNIDCKKGKTKTAPPVIVADVPPKNTTSSTPVPSTKVTPKPQTTPNVASMPETKPTKPVKPDLLVDAKGKPKKLKSRKVTQQKGIVVDSDDITIAVWDYAAIDNDTISLNFNGQWLLQEYGLVKQKKYIKVHLDKQDNYILLYAHNLGSIPPNTLTMSINDGKAETVTRLESNLNTCGYVRVTRRE